MESLILTMAKGLVEKPDEVSVDKDEVNEDGIVVYHLHVSKEDMGRVIGKQGKIAKAIRMIVRSAAITKKIKEKVVVEIDWGHFKYLYGEGKCLLPFVVLLRGLYERIFRGGENSFHRGTQRGSEGIPLDQWNRFFMWS